MRLLTLQPSAPSLSRYALHRSHIRRASTAQLSSKDLYTRLPYRRGRNLGDRFLILEKSLRGKEAMTRSRDDQSVRSSMPRSSSSKDIFRGFALPIKPSPPKSDECCMSGCAVCVYDLYEESLAAYEESVEKLRTSLASLSIPEYEWPEHIQTKNSSTQSPPKTSVVMSAFEELERRLKEKSAAQ